MHAASGRGPDLARSVEGGGGGRGISSALTVITKEEGEKGKMSFTREERLGGGACSRGN